MRRSILICSLFLFLFSPVFVANAQADSQSPGNEAPSRVPGTLILSALTIGQVATLGVNTMSVVRWERRHWGWGVGGAVLGGVGMYYSFAQMFEGFDSVPMLKPARHTAVSALVAVNFFMGLANMGMGVWTGFLPESKVQVSIQPMAMGDVQGTISPGLGLQIVGF